MPKAHQGKRVVLEVGRSTVGARTRGQQRTGEHGDGEQNERGARQRRGVTHRGRHPAVGFVTWLSELGPMADEGLRRRGDGQLDSWTD